MKKSILIFCLLSAYMVLFFQLGSLPFYGADEPRYARIGQEMLASGDFITPTLDGRPWMEKPPLLYWMEAASYALAGIDEGSARLPNALLALLSAIAVGFLGWKITRDFWVGILAYLVLISSCYFVLFGRAASTDMALTAPYVLMMVFLFLALEEDSSVWAGLAGVGGAAAVLAKGPVALGLGLATAAIYLFLIRRGPSRRVGVVFFLVLASLSLPWFVLVWLANEENFFFTFILNHHIARFVTDLHHHSQPFWYYLPVLLGGFFPWIFFIFPAGRDFFRRGRGWPDQESRLRLYLWIWAVFPFVFFSASSAKLPGYILPIIPSLALLVSLEWKRYISHLERWAGSFALQAALVIFASFLGVGLAVGAEMEYGRIDVGLAVGIPLVAGVLLGIWWGRKKVVLNSFLALSGGMIIAMSALFAVGSPVVARYHSTAELVGMVDEQVSDLNPLVQYRFFHHTAIYYTGGEITPDSVNSPAEMAAYIKRKPQDEYLLLTTRHGWEEFHDLPGTEVIGPVGKLFVLKLCNQDRELADRISNLE